MLRLVDGEVSAIQRFFTSVIVDREPITVQSPASALSLATALIDAFLSPRTPRAINFGSISL